MVFGERLKKERKRLGLSAEKFGGSLGLSGNTQYSYEKGDRSPDVTYLNQIQHLGCDVIYIVTGLRAVSTISDDEFRLLHAYRSASDPVRTAALAALSSGSLPKATKSIRIRGSVGQFVDGDVSFSEHVDFSHGKNVKGARN